MLRTDEYQSFTTPVAAATTFLLSLATNRTKFTFLPILGFINTVVRLHGPPEHRFGALNMTAALGKQIIQHPDARKSVEQFLLQYVSPELEGPEAYLRAIVSFTFSLHIIELVITLGMFQALEIVGTVTRHRFQWSSEELLGKHFQVIFRLLDDDSFPVKVNAALCLTEMIIAYESGMSDLCCKNWLIDITRTVHKAVAPQVGKVIQGMQATKIFLCSKFKMFQICSSCRTKQISTF